MILQNENKHQRQQNYDNKLYPHSFKSQAIFFPETKSSTTRFHFGNVCIVGVSPLPTSNIF